MRGTRNMKERGRRETGRVSDKEGEADGQKGETEKRVSEGQLKRVRGCWDTSANTCLLYKTMCI